MHPNRPQSSSSTDHAPGSNRYYLPPQPQSHPLQPGRSSMSAHRLPPPIPSQASPRQRHFLLGSPVYRDPPTLGHTDPASWASDRPISNRSSSRWSPTLPGLALSPSQQESGRDRSRDRNRDRERPGTAQRQGQNAFNNQHHRLPPLADFPPRPGSGWGDPPSTGHSSTSRPPTSYDYFRPSSSSSHQPAHPLAQNLQPYPPGFGPPAHGHPHTRPPVLERRLSDSGAYTPITESPDPASSLRAHDSPQAGAGAGDGGKNKKKRRVALSCAECAKRKQKCNRETPCQHCVSRRVPELCVPYTRNVSPPPTSAGTVAESASAAVRGKESRGDKEIKAERKELANETSTESGPSRGISDSGINKRARVETLERRPVEGSSSATATAPAPRSASMLPTLSVRVMRLEAIVNSIINKVDGLEGKALQDWRINHAPATTPPPRDAEATTRPRAASLVSSARSRPNTGDTAIARELSIGGEGLMTGIDVESSTRNPLPQSMIATADPVPLILDYHGTPAEQLQRLFKDCGVSPHKVQDLMAELPPRSDADGLIDWFFTKINYIRYPISEHLFRKSFNLLYERRTIGSAAVLALPLVFIVLAMAIRVAPEEWGEGEAEKRSNSLRMYWNSRMAVSMATAVKAETIELVETRICTGLYLVLMHERRLAEGWAEFRAALTTGQAIGMHRDGAKLGLDTYSTEYRRRLWSYLVHADATYSCLLGRPISIDLRSCDTLPPSNLDLSSLETLDPAQPIQPKPAQQPTFATYLILRRAVGEIVARITQTFQRLDGGGDYADIRALDSDLTRLRDDLPAAFRMEDPDRSYDEKCWYLPVHRYYIQTEILHFTIILHRPWLLRRLKSNRYQRSRQACFEAAVMDHKIREAWKKDCPDFFETLLGSSFREFNASMIAGISLIIDSHSPHATDMRDIVSSFMEEHPLDPKADDFSQTEAAIIHTLHRRAQEMNERRANDQRTRGRAQVSNERAQSVLPESHPDPSIHNHGQDSEGIAHSGDDSLPRHDSDTSQNEVARHHTRTEDGAYDTTPIKAAPHSFPSDGSGAGRPGLTPASSGSEDDQPQRLLDQWLISNSSFGPGVDSFSNPFMFTYPGFPLAYQYNAMAPQIATQPLQAHVTASAMGTMGNTGLFYDPDLTAAGTSDAQSLNGFGITPVSEAAPAPAPVAMPGTVPSLVGPIGDDGNPTVFWDRLIDGIVVGQGFELVNAPG